MDEMTMYEARDIIDYIPYMDKTYKELTRYGLYVDINAHSKHSQKAKDILPLPWDITNKDIEEDEETVKSKNEAAMNMAAFLNSGHYTMAEAKNIH